VTLVRTPVSEIAGRLMPWIMRDSCDGDTGGLLFLRFPSRPNLNIFFRIKVAFLCWPSDIAVFQRVWRSMSQWDLVDVPPFGARLAAARLRCALWAAILVADV